MRLLSNAALLLFLAPLIASCDYNLGGPCHDEAALTSQKQIIQAEQSHNWDQLIAFRKLDVRAGCTNAYRWNDLVDSLLEAGRPEEASQALQAMDARGFEINPSFLATNFPRVEGFLNTPLFEASPLGQKLGKLEAASNERRQEFAQRLKQLLANERPAEHYVVKNACPFECCRYGDWTVLADANLVADPGSTRVVGKALKGSHVKALTGEVHLTPEPVGVLQNAPFPQNSIVFLLDHLGEGVANFYADGKIVQAPASFSKYCFRPSEACWGETILPSPPEAVWWVKIRLSNGVTGWSPQSNNFGNKDACG